MRSHYILIFCIQSVISVEADFPNSSGTLEADVSETSHSEQSADHEALTRLASALVEAFDSLEKIIVTSEWTDLMVIETVTSQLNQTIGDIKIHDQKQSLDYLLRRIIQKLDQSVENIIETMPPIVQMRQVLQEIPNGLESVHIRNASLEIYQEWLSSVESDLAHLCNYYAYGDLEKKEDITAYLNKIVELLEKLGIENRTIALRDEIYALDITVSLLLESINSGELMNEITQMDLNIVSTSTTNDNSIGKLESNHEVEFLYGMVTDMEKLLNDTEQQNTPDKNRTGLDIHIKRDQIKNLIKAIGVENIPEENRRGRLLDIKKHLEENVNNNGYKTRNSAMINDVKIIIDQLKKEQILDNYINLSKKYSQINSLINLLIKQMLESDIQEEFEMELLAVLTDLIAIQGEVIRTVQLLPDTEKPVHGDTRNERLNNEINEIEVDVDELSRIVNSHVMPYILPVITNQTLTVLEKLNVIALNYLPEDILGKIYHVNVYLISLVASARAFDKNTREENDAMKKKLDELKSQMLEIDEDFIKILREFKEGNKDLNILRTQAGNIFIRISKLRMLDYITDDLLNELVRLEDAVLTFITKDTSFKKIQNGTLDVDDGATSLISITHYQNLLSKLQNRSENSNWHSLQKILFEIESIEYKISLQKELTSLNNDHHILIEKLYEDINKLKRGVIGKIEKQELLDPSCNRMDYQYIENVEKAREDSVINKIDSFERDLKQLKSSLTEQTRNDWFSLTSLGYMTEQLIYELQLLQGTRPSVESKDRINTLVEEAEAFITELALTIKERNYTVENPTQCEYEVYSYKHGIQEELQKILSSLRGIIRDTREDALTQMYSIEESLLNVIQNTHSIIINGRINNSIKQRDNLASLLVNSPDIVHVNLTAVLVELQEGIEFLREQTMVKNDNENLETLLRESLNIFHLLEIFQRFDASNSSKAKFEQLKEEVKMITDSIDSQIKQLTEENNTDNQNTGRGDGTYNEILQSEEDKTSGRVS